MFGLDAWKENAAAVGHSALGTSKTAILILCGCALFFLIIKLILNYANEQS